MTIHAVRGVDGTEFSGVGGILGSGGLSDVLPAQVPSREGVGFEDLAEFGVSQPSSAPAIASQPYPAGAPPQHSTPAPLPGPPQHGMVDPRTQQVIPLGPQQLPQQPMVPPGAPPGPTSFGVPGPQGATPQQQQNSKGSSWMPWLLLAGAAGVVAGGVYVLSRGGGREDD